MICPACHTQMIQKDSIGGGASTDILYATWEIKECPGCGRLVKESYRAEVIDREKLNIYKQLDNTYR